MTEYIERLQVLTMFNNIVNNCNDKDEFYNRAFDLVDTMPSADVMPKSEHEAELDDLTICLEAECKVCGERTNKVIVQLQDKIADLECDYNLYKVSAKDVLEHAKTEVAKEIFENIEKLKYTKWDWSDVVDWDGIAELKEKYVMENL